MSKCSKTNLAVILLLLLLIPSICLASWDPAVQVIEAEPSGKDLYITIKNVSDTDYRFVRVWAIIGNGEYQEKILFIDTGGRFRAGAIISIRAMPFTLSDFNKIRYTDSQTDMPI